uniref:GST C-terminal domain-containing protein n=2 Tax=Parascaris univalens TaxID=6257 RepID=A0A915CAR1_PARUN
MTHLDLLPNVPQVFLTLFVALMLKWMITCFTGWLSSKKLHEVHKKDWKKDVVYLYQFKRLAVVPNLSPFCLKVEAWLRANNIKYEICDSWMQRSKEGLLPFVELNGEQIADSQLIIARLQKHFSLDDGLKGTERGAARAVDRMLDGSTFYALLYSKVLENATKLVSRDVSGLHIPTFLLPLVAALFAQKMRKRLMAEGMARHEREDIVAILRRDVQAVDDLLGDKKFLFGDKLTTPDFSVFGHLATTYYLPYNQPITDLLNNDFPRVKDYIERIKTDLFPEWRVKDEREK